MRLLEGNFVASSVNKYKVWGGQNLDWANFLSYLVVSSCWFFCEVVRCANYHPNRIYMALESGCSDGQQWKKGGLQIHTPKSQSV